LNIPLCAFYSVDRTVIKTSQTFDLEKLDPVSQTSKFDALKSALDGSTNIEDFLKWFIFIDNLKSGTEIEKEKEELVSSIKTLESLSLKSKIILKELKELKARLHDINDHAYNQNYTKLDRQKTFIKDAITSSVKSISNIFIDRSSGRAEVKITDNGTDINIFQASKGQLVYISLIADLARRLILLNPNLSNPLNGQGIVLIDEIELHLHPEWQRSIISNLTKTFCNIQFIITTHSAQVLTTSSRNNIRSLSENTNGDDIAAIPPIETYARTPSDVMLSVMHVDPKPDYPEKMMLNKYRTIIEQGDFRSSEAKELYIILVNKLGPDHEELIKLEMIKRKRERFE
jgi:predicted ATP-binding protein involved in virulence